MNLVGLKTQTSLYEVESILSVNHWSIPALLGSLYMYNDRFYVDIAESLL